MSYRGEYWYNGYSIVFADGDTGDFNHAGYATEHCRRCLFNLMSVDPDKHEWDSVHSVALCFLADLAKDGETYADFEDWMLKNHPDKMGLWSAAEGNDPVDYVMEHEGWVKVNQRNIGVWFLRHEDFDNIADAVDEIYESEEDEPQQDQEWEVYVVSTGNRYSITTKELQDREYGIMQIAAPSGRSNLAMSLDKVNNMPCYGGNLGD